MTFKPDKNQKKMIRFMLKQPACALFADPGLRKTASVLGALDILMDEGIVKKTLIVASIRIIHSVWPKEIKKWGFSFKVAMVHGDHKLKALKSKADIYLINYEGITWLEKQPKKLRSQFEMLVIDESTKFKNWSSQRFKALKRMLDYFDRRYILTGTPVPNGLIDIFSQIYILDQGDSLGQFITHFKNEYFDTVMIKYNDRGVDRQFPKISLQPGGEQRIHKAIKHIVIRLDISSAKMPKCTDNFIEVDLPKKVAKQYRDMEEQLATDLKKGVVLAANAGVATSKLRQMVNGHIYDNDKKFHFLHNAKIDALVDLVDELQGSPLLVGYEFKSDLEMLLKAFPKTKYIGGGVSTKDALKIEKDWNNGKLPLLFGQIASVAHGLNLQDAGNHLAFYSLTWNLEDYLQFVRRVWRQGQKKHVVVHHIVVSDSVDLDVWNTLKGKNKTQSSLLNSFKKRIAR